MRRICPYLIRKSAPTGLLLFICLLLSCGSSEQKGKGEPTNVNEMNTSSEDKWGEPVNGLRSRIFTDKQVFRGNEAIPVHYLIRNISSDSIYLWHRGFWPNNRITVTDPEGNPANLTEEGRIRDAAFGSNESGKNVRVTLMPGQTDEAYEAYDLRGMFVMDMPGTYQITYAYQESGSGWSGTLTSNTLHIQLEK